MCCERCASLVGLHYTVDGDGDGVEFLTQSAERYNTPVEITTVVFRN